MEQRDFILREIERIGAMLRMFIRRRFEQKDTRDEEDDTEQLFGEFYEETGIDLDTLLQLSKNDFEAFFKIYTGFNYENTELMADFIVELSKSSTSQNPLELIQKAVELYSYIDQNSKTYSMERAAKIQLLEAFLKQ